MLATAMTSSYLSDYALQLNQLTRPLQLESIGPRAFPNSYAEATKRFSETALASVVSVFPTSAKTAYGFTEDTALTTGVVVTSDGWVAVPFIPNATAELLSVQIKDQVYDVVRVVVDPLTQTVFLKCNAANLTVVGFGSAFDLSTGDQLFMSIQSDRFAQASVLEQLTQQGLVLSSDVVTRRVLLATHLNGISAPLFDLSGSFVGFSQKKEAQTLLVPFEQIQPGLNAVLEKKTISHPSLGVSYVDLAHAVGFDETLRRGRMMGAYVTGYTTAKKGSAAAVAGIMEGDILLSVNGQELTSARGLQERLLSLRAGDTVNIQLDRAGEVKTMEVVLGEYTK